MRIDQHCTYDDAKHKYTLDGQVVPSVTQTIDAAGLIDRTGWTEEARERGTAVHALVNQFCVGRICGTGPGILAIEKPLCDYYEQFLRFTDTCDFRPIYSERVVYSLKHQYAGTLDLYGILRGKPTIIDVKTGGAPAWALEQMGLYSICCREMKMPVSQVACLELTPKKFSLTPYLRTVAESAGLSALKKAREVVCE